MYYALNEWSEHKLPEEPSEENLLGLEIALTYLPQRTKDIILCRFKECISYEDVGKNFNLCGCQINKIVIRGLRNLIREYSEIINRGLHGYIDYCVEKRLADIAKDKNEKGYEGGYNDAKRFYEAKLKELNAASKISIEEMNLSVRAYNCLKRAGYVTAYDLLQLSQLDVFRIRNLGINARKEISLALDRIGYINDVWREWI